VLTIATDSATPFIVKIIAKGRTKVKGGTHFITTIKISKERLKM
jgi:hypothetical protein